MGATACGVEAPLTDSTGTPLGEKSAATVLENLETETAMNLVARVELQPNDLLEFYEPAPGLIVVSRAGAPEGGLSPLPRATTNSGIRELWARATNGKPVTVELAEALERAEQRLAARGLADGDLNAGSTISAREVHAQPPAAPAAEPPAVFARSGGWCDTVYLAGDHGNCVLDASEQFTSQTWRTEFTQCMPNHWDGAWAHHNDVLYGYMSVCAAEGTPVTFAFWTDENVSGSWTVNVNTFRHAYVFDSGCTLDFDFNDCTSLHAEVQQALGDRFHFAFLADVD
ncbi:hypothetical protein WMF18_31770 [Sorangium sp. So ce315]|uniref:hypothetical protein n=1 Tax=Sorangium sp. So ce315 TaxID=3133299 RepID=UPI003F625529